MCHRRVLWETQQRHDHLGFLAKNNFHSFLSSLHSRFRHSKQNFKSSKPGFYPRKSVANNMPIFIARSGMSHLSFLRDETYFKAFIDSNWWEAQGDALSNLKSTHLHILFKPAQWLVSPAHWQSYFKPSGLSRVSLFQCMRLIQSTYFNYKDVPSSHRWRQTHHHGAQVPQRA